MNSTSTIQFDVTGSAPPVPNGGFDHDLLVLGGNAALGCNLSVALLDGINPDPLAKYTLIGAANLSDAFSNVLDGERVDTLGGEGSFQVNYDSASNQVILSDFMLAFILGDMNGDGQFDAFDGSAFEITLANIGASATVPKPAMGILFEPDMALSTHAARVLPCPLIARACGQACRLELPVNSD